MDPRINLFITKLDTSIKELEYSISNIDYEFQLEKNKINSEKNGVVQDGLVFSLHNLPNELLAPGLTSNIKTFFFKYRQTLSSILKLFKLLEKELLIETSSQMVDGSGDGKFGKWVKGFYEKSFVFKPEVEKYLLDVEKPLLVSYAIRNALKEVDDFKIIQINTNDIYFQVDIGNRFIKSTVGEKLFEIWDRTRAPEQYGNYKAIKFVLLDLQNTLIIINDLRIIINNALKISPQH